VKFLSACDTIVVSNFEFYASSVAGVEVWGRLLVSHGFAGCCWARRLRCALTLAERRRPLTCPQKSRGMCGTVALRLAEPPWERAPSARSGLVRV